jgi:hypothetical protein
MTEDEIVDRIQRSLDWQWLQDLPEEAITDRVADTVFDELDRRGLVSDRTTRLRAAYERLRELPFEPTPPRLFD